MIEIDENGYAFNPDYICQTSPRDRKVRAWFVTDAGPQENENGIYVFYKLNENPEYARGFTLNAEEAKSLISDLVNALQKHGQ